MKRSPFSFFKTMGWDIREAPFAHKPIRICMTKRAARNGPRTSCAYG